MRPAPRLRPGRRSPGARAGPRFTIGRDRTEVEPQLCGPTRFSSVPDTAPMRPLHRSPTVPAHLKRLRAGRGAARGGRGDGLCGHALGRVPALQLRGLPGDLVRARPPARARLPLPRQPTAAPTSPSGSRPTDVLNRLIGRATASCPPRAPSGPATSAGTVQHASLTANPDLARLPAADPPGRDHPARARHAAGGHRDVERRPLRDALGPGLEERRLSGQGDLGEHGPDARPSTRPARSRSRRSSRRP